MTLILQDDIIEPVRNALAYYTDMQKALEELKLRKAKEENGDVAPLKNGLKSK